LLFKRMPEFQNVFVKSLTGWSGAKGFSEFYSYFRLLSFYNKIWQYVVKQLKSCFRRCTPFVLWFPIWFMRRAFSVIYLTSKFIIQPFNKIGFCIGYSENKEMAVFLFVKNNRKMSLSIKNASKIRKVGFIHKLFMHFQEMFVNNLVINVQRLSLRRVRPSGRKCPPPQRGDDIVPTVWKHAAANSLAG